MKKISLRAMALLLTLTLLCGAIPTAFATFPDVPADAWYLEDLERLVKLGGIHGMPDGRFAPDECLTLAQLLKLLGSLLWPGAAHTPVENTPWYTPYAALAEENGLSQGISLTTARLETAVSRYDLALVAVNAARLRGETPENPEHTIPYIGDYSQIPEAYRPAVTAGFSLGLIQGVDDQGSFCGDIPLTRSQVCTLAMRIVDPTRRALLDFRSAAAYTGDWNSGTLRVSLSPSGDSVSLYRADGQRSAGPIAVTQTRNLLELGEFRDSAGTRYRGIVYLLEDCLYLQLSAAPDTPEAGSFVSALLTRPGIPAASLENRYYTALAGADAPSDALGLAIFSPTPAQLTALGPYTDLTDDSGGCQALVVPRYTGTVLRVTDGAGTVLRAAVTGDSHTAMLCTVCPGMGLPHSYYTYLIWSPDGVSHSGSCNFPCISGAFAGGTIYFS